MRIIEVPDHLALRILRQLEEFESLPGMLKRMEKQLNRIEGHEEQADIDIEALAAKVEAGTALDVSIKELVVGIAEELENSSDPKVQALALRLREQNNALAAAVAANLVSK